MVLWLDVALWLDVVLWLDAVLCFDVVLGSPRSACYISDKGDAGRIFA
jgi:hypothetical protein